MPDPKVHCDVCESGWAFGFCAVPAVPITCAYCKKCLDANAHPWKILIANTAMLGGLDRAAEFWKDMVKDTCRHLDKSLEDFNKEVQKTIDDMEKEESKIFGKIAESIEDVELTPEQMERARDMLSYSGSFDPIKACRYIIYLKDKIKAWEDKCTGKHGSQVRCLEW